MYASAIKRNKMLCNSSQIEFICLTFMSVQMLSTCCFMHTELQITCFRATSPLSLSWGAEPPLYKVGGAIAPQPPVPTPMSMHIDLLHCVVSNSF